MSEERKPRIWALSDPHLSAGGENRQERWGEVWVDHATKILDNVKRLCGPDDILLMPGDISWAKKITDIAPDFELLSQMPCSVVLSEGNHDHWASKQKEVIENLPENCTWIMKSMFRRGNVAIVAARLCDFEGIFPWPGHFPCKKFHGPKIEARELIRLEDALSKLPQDEGVIRVLMVHFPPLAHDASPGKLTELIDKYNVDYCVYGHVHGQSEKIPAVDAMVGRTRYILASADWVNMEPVEICESD